MSILDKFVQCLETAVKESLSLDIDSKIGTELRQTKLFYF